MTQNQIRYQEHVETKRHNMTTEQESGRHNRADESIRRDTQEESARHNRQTEFIDLFKANETQRHNQRTERQAVADLEELTRSNKAREAENTRHNKAAETENVRHNIVSENTALSSLAENARHNRASETNESKRAAASMQQASAAMTSANTGLMEVKRKADRDVWEKSTAESNALANRVKAASEGVKAKTAVDALDLKKLEIGADYIKAIGDIIPF